MPPLWTSRRQDGAAWRFQQCRSLGIECDAGGSAGVLQRSRSAPYRNWSCQLGFRPRSAVTVKSSGHFMRFKLSDAGRRAEVSRPAAPLDPARPSCSTHRELLIANAEALNPKDRAGPVNNGLRVATTAAGVTPRWRVHRRNRYSTLALAAWALRRISASASVAGIGLTKGIVTPGRQHQAVVHRPRRGVQHDRGVADVGDVRRPVMARMADVDRLGVESEFSVFAAHGSISFWRWGAPPLDGQTESLVGEPIAGTPHRFGDSRSPRALAAFFFGDRADDDRQRLVDPEMIGRPCSSACSISP